MTIAEAHAEFKLFAIADPLRALKEVQSACVALGRSEAPECRATCEDKR